MSNNEGISIYNSQGQTFSHHYLSWDARPNDWAIL